MSADRPADPAPDVTLLARLLDAALDLDPSERAAWLLEVRRTTPAAGAAVSSLLAREPALEAQGFLDRTTSPDTLALPTLAGHGIGHYTLLRPLGRGAMGAVWLARRNDGRYEAEVAIKLLNLSLLDPVGRERFRREGNTLARVTHPNISHLIDAGVTSLGQPYLVLERVDGEPIDEYCDRLCLAPESRIRLFRQVLSAVVHAHASLVVHRDLKPSNILVTADGTVKLLDFGIAKLLEEDTGAAERTELTEAGGAPLTPAYAAPEQVTGAPITVGTDVYALGVLLHVLLSGSHPTGGQGRTGPEQLRDLVDREPVRLATAITAEAAPRRAASLGRLRRLYAGDLGTIVARALEKDPARRYPTVAELRDDLDRLLRNEPVLARPASRSYRLRKFVRRNRVLASIGAIAAVSLLLGTGIASMQMMEARRQRDEAQVQRDRAFYESRRAGAVSGFMLSLVSGLHPEERASPVELVNRARAILERDHDAEPGFVARMLLELSDEFFGTAPIPTMNGMLERAVELAERSGEPALAGQAHCTLAAYRLRTSASPDSGRPHLRAGLRALSRRPPDHAAASGRCRLAEMKLRWLEGSRDSARVLAGIALAHAESTMDTLSPAFGRLLNAIAEQHLYLGRLRTARELAQRAGATFRRSGRAETAQALEALAIENSALEGLQPAASDSVFGMWQQLSRRLGRESAFAIENRVAQHALVVGRPESAVAIWTAALGREVPGTPRYLNTLSWIARANIDAGRLPEARRAIEQMRRVPDPPGTHLLIVEGRLAEAEGDASLALARYRELLESTRSSEASRSGAFWIYNTRAARMALLNGDLALSDSLAAEAYAQSLRFRPEDSLSMGRIRLVQGRVRAARGDTAAALRLAVEAMRGIESGMGNPAASPGEIVAARELLLGLRTRALPHTAGTASTPDN